MFFEHLVIGDKIDTLGKKLESLSQNTQSNQDKKERTRGRVQGQRGGTRKIRRKSIPSGHNQAASSIQGPDNYKE